MSFPGSVVSQQGRCPSPALHQGAAHLSRFILCASEAANGIMQNGSKQKKPTKPNNIKRVRINFSYFALDSALSFE